MLLKDKVAIITGGGSGIGRAAVRLFAEQGAVVHIFDRTDDGADVCKDVRDDGGQCFFHQVDLRDKDATVSCVNVVRERHQMIDVLFSNAGINPHIGSIEATSDADWTEIIQTNLESCFQIIRTVIPTMVQQKEGAIIGTSSISGRVWASDHSVPYGVTKTGIEAIIKSVAAQYGPMGIRSNCILPGFIETPLNWVNDDEVKERIISRIPLRRPGRPEDIAKVALFLASDLSSYVNGESIIVDGGFTL